MIKNQISIGNIELKNRLIMPPVATYLSTDDGKVTDRLIEYYGERAKGGSIGMIITEHCYISQQGKAKAKQLSIANDDDVEGLTRLVNAIHQNGTKAMAQLNHAGATTLESLTGMRKVSANATPLPMEGSPLNEVLPEALTTEGISEIVDDFVRAAVRAKAAGYDGVEIHSAHTYLLNQFYSPLTNKREDEYGGSLENRLRFHVEVIKQVRKAVGPDYLISLRLGGCDYMEGGSTIEDAVNAVKILEAAGIDMIDLSGGMCSYRREGHDEPGYFKDMSIPVKAAVSIPVMLTGGVTKIREAEDLLREKAADLIGVGRELLKDPHWADREMGIKL